MKDHKDKMWCVCVYMCLMETRKIEAGGKNYPLFSGLDFNQSAQLISTQATVEGSDEQEAASQSWLGAFINAEILTGVISKVEKQAKAC